MRCLSAVVTFLVASQCHSAYALLLSSPQKHYQSSGSSQEPFPRTTPEGMTIWPEPVEKNSARLSRSQFGQNSGTFMKTAEGRLERLMNATLPMDDPCRCQNWQRVYDYQTVACGHGLEYVPRIDDAMDKFESVPDFFASMDDNYLQRRLDVALGLSICPMLRKINTEWCIRTGKANTPGKWYSSSWCWVKPECDSPNAFQHGDDLLKVKLCESPDDFILADVPVDMAVGLAKQSGIESAAMFVEWAYPTERSLLVDDLKQHRADVNRLREKNEPVVIEKPNDCKYIMHGNLSYYVPLQGYETFSGTGRWGE